MEITITELQELVNTQNIETIKSGLNSITQPVSKRCLWVIGEKYIIRTVTFTYLGRLIDITNEDLLLEDASWVADTGRFHKALLNGISGLEEIEPYPGEALINRSAYVDGSKWLHDLPRETK